MPPYDGEKCPICGDNLSRIARYEGRAENPKEQLVWCSSPECERYGVPLDPVTLEPKTEY